MCRPLQYSSRCISTAKAYRAKTKGSWAVSANRIGAQSRFALASSRHLDVSTLHQRPRPHASPPLSLLNRSSAVSTLWMNATTVLRRHWCKAVQALSTHLPKRSWSVDSTGILARHPVIRSCKSSCARSGVRASCVSLKQ